MVVGILDYKACNILSVYNSIYRLGEDPMIVKHVNDLNLVDKLVIPGVGSAFECLKYLKLSGFFDGIINFYEKKKPIFAICLGFQIFAKTLHEGGLSTGLGIIDADVVKLDLKKKFNIGWSTVHIKKEFCEKISLGEFSNFYFCHSYFVNINKREDKKFCIGLVDEMNNVPALYIKNNLIACQFHPEKSQKNGEKLIKFFLDM